MSVIYSKKLTVTQKLMNWKGITDHNHDKYITTPEFNKFTAELFALKLKKALLGLIQANLKEFQKEVLKI